MKYINIYVFFFICLFVIIHAIFIFLFIPALTAAVERQNTPAAAYASGMSFFALVGRATFFVRKQGMALIVGKQTQME